MKFRLITPILLYLLSVTNQVNAQQDFPEPMLMRKLVYPDSMAFVPYTNLCFIHNAELPDDSGWVMEYIIKKSRQQSLLVIEMNSSDILGYNYSSGSVQLVVEVPDFKDSITFGMQSPGIRTSLVNNYGSISATTDPPKGTFTLTRMNGQIRINGQVELTTSQPYTRQLIEFKDNLIPVYSLHNYQELMKEKELQMEKMIDEVIEEIVKEIMEDTIPSAEEAEKQLPPPSQGFRFSYRNYGLGSNRWSSSRVVVLIENDVLSYGIMKQSSEIDYINPATGDTTWKNKRSWQHVPFSTTSRDSILALIATAKGSDLYYSNYHIMSGSIHQFYIGYEGWCTSISMQNVSNANSNRISALINAYLPDDYKLSITTEPGWYDDQTIPGVEECKGNRNFTAISGEAGND